MKVVVILLSLLLVPVAEAKPWYKDWKVWVVGAVTIGSSIVATKAIHDCRRRVGIEKCDGGYGPFAAREAIRGSFSVGMFSLSLWSRHEGFKEWSAPALGATTWNSVVAIQNASRSCPKTIPERPCFR